MGVPCARQNVNSIPGLCPLDAGRTAWAVTPNLSSDRCPPGGEKEVNSTQLRVTSLDSFA